MNPYPLNTYKFCPPRRLNAREAGRNRVTALSSKKPIIVIIGIIKLGMVQAAFEP